MTEDEFYKMMVDNRQFLESQGYKVHEFADGIYVSKGLRVILSICGEPLQGKRKEFAKEVCRLLAVREFERCL